MPPSLDSCDAQRLLATATWPSRERAGKDPPHILFPTVPGHVRVGRFLLFLPCLVGIVHEAVVRIIVSKRVQRYAHRQGPSVWEAEVQHA